MKIGVEIESESIYENNRDIIEKYLEKTEWDIKDDASLENGTEVTSPILTGNMEKASNEIKSVCAVLNGIPQIISERCGGHIHIDAGELTTKQDFVNLLEIWSYAEKILYIISNEKGEIPRKKVSKYAPPISEKLEKAIEVGTVNLEKEEDLEKFVHKITNVQCDRYSGINFCNIDQKEKNTVEFRLSNGTINPNTWIENINLFGGIIKVSHELTTIQKKSEEQRTEHEKNLLENFEKLFTEKEEEQIAKALINLCIIPENRQTYMDRYLVNSVLLNKTPDVKNAIMEQLSTSKIGEKVFIGKNAINGVEYKKSEKIINCGLYKKTKNRN